MAMSAPSQRGERRFLTFYTGAAVLIVNTIVLLAGLELGAVLLGRVVGSLDREMLHLATLSTGSGRPKQRVAGARPGPNTESKHGEGCP